jgi:uncharacterized membrane protein
VSAAPLAALLVGGADDGRSYDLQQADVAVTLQQDGSLQVVEQITVYFSGPYTFGYRDIPLRDAESIADVQVLEGGQAYRPGAPTELAPGGPPSTFGVTSTDGGVRIVWRFEASFEARTFTLAYRLDGVAVAYDDVVDVNVQVWGDEWQQGLGRLTASLTAPADVDRAWGHPVYVRGDVTLDGPTVLLRAERIPAQQFVELRALVPRSALTSTSAATVREGDGREEIVAAEQGDAATFESESARIDALVQRPALSLGLLLLAGLVPATLLVLLVFSLYGRERGSGYDREYEQEPPDDLAPALLPTLVRQGGTAGSLEFTATLFDLIRRGVYRAHPVTTRRPVWGGLRQETISDLELSSGDRNAVLEPWEQDVAHVVDAVLATGPQRLSQFRDLIEADRAAMSVHFSAFQEHVSAEVSARGWLVSRGARPLAWALLLLVLGAVAAFVAAGNGWRSTYPRWSDVVWLVLGVAALLNAGVVIGALTQRRLWRHYSPQAQLTVERWTAFRRYLTDFPRLDEAPPATLALWERLLVYGIVFGIAERVLQAAHLAMPEQLAQASSVYWISSTGDLGSGATSMSIGDLAAGFGSALAPRRPGRVVAAAASRAEEGEAAAEAAAASAEVSRSRGDEGLERHESVPVRPHQGDHATESLGVERRPVGRVRPDVHEHDRSRSQRAVHPCHDGVDALPSARAHPAQGVDGPPHRHVAAAVDQRDGARVPRSEGEPEVRARVLAGHVDDRALAPADLAEHPQVAEGRQVEVAVGVVAHGELGGEALRRDRVGAGERPREEERARGVAVGEDAPDAGHTRVRRSGVERERHHLLGGGDDLDVSAQQAFRQGAGSCLRRGRVRSRCGRDVGREAGRRQGRGEGDEHRSDQSRDGVHDNPSTFQ